MIPKIISFLYFISVCAGSKPILFSDNPSAVPVQSFDFVYIPKEVVQTHLPAFEQKRLRLRAEHAIKELKLNVPVPADTTAQLQLVGLLKRKQISEKDPKGEKRKALKRELCKMNTELNLLVPIRRNLISDIQRLQRTAQKECTPTNLNSRLSDKQDAECRAMKDYITFQSSQLMKMNQKERIYLQRMRDIRKEINLL
jgi:hypothetical protein